MVKQILHLMAAINTIPPSIIDIIDKIVTALNPNVLYLNANIIL